MKIRLFSNRAPKDLEAEINSWLSGLTIVEKVRQIQTTAIVERNEEVRLVVTILYDGIS
jgi:hypothetical protein